MKNKRERTETENRQYRAQVAAILLAVRDFEDDCIAQAVLDKERDKQGKELGKILTLTGKFSDSLSKL